MKRDGTKPDAAGTRCGARAACSLLIQYGDAELPSRIRHRTSDLSG
jgi:hypothetical protein